MKLSPDPKKALLTELNKCRACRFCVDVCPTYQVSGGLEALSSFGRIQIIRHLLTGMLELDDSLSYALYSCLQCRRCENTCKAKGQALDICQIIQQARAYLAPDYAKEVADGV
ncbi:MAG: (Fe-S)-binding protein [Desulfarculaceae bacterium]|nr:(Fe-S)-binding protein [Desulfarculaceae bacterium]